MKVGKKSCIEPAVAVGSGGGASVTGKGVRVSVVCVAVFTGISEATFVGAEVGVGEGAVFSGVNF